MTQAPVKSQVLNSLRCYNKLSRKDLRRLDKTRLMHELTNMLEIKRLYSQVYGNPEGNSIDMNLY